MPVGAGRDRRSWPDLAGDGARKDSVLRGRVHVGADVVGVREWRVPGRQALKDVCRDSVVARGQMVQRRTSMRGRRSGSQQ